MSRAVRRWLARESGARLERFRSHLLGTLSATALCWARSHLVLAGQELCQLLRGEGYRSRTGSRTLIRRGVWPCRVEGNFSAASSPSARHPVEAADLQMATRHSFWKHLLCQREAAERVRGSLRAVLSHAPSDWSGQAELFGVSLSLHLLASSCQLFLLPGFGGQKSSLKRQRACA